MGTWRYQLQHRPGDESLGIAGDTSAARAGDLDTAVARAVDCECQRRTRR